MIVESILHALTELINDERSGKNMQAMPIKKIFDKHIEFINNNNCCKLHLDMLRKKDAASFKHLIFVSAFSIVIGQALGFYEDDLIDLSLAGLLHDIGKINIPSEILLKSGPLTSKEFKIVKEHSHHGYNILKSSADISERISSVILQHHEKCDGSGYPNGLIANQIDDWSKIISIADIYDALTCDRSYRKKLIPNVAMEYLISDVSQGKIDAAFTKKFINIILIKRNETMEGVL